jgi:phosphatidylserine/phosphatidylglycerophosphate/cardiolipin synthase-like enzyme
MLLKTEAWHQAQKTVYVQAYSFTTAPIAQALVDAHKRGVDVQVILDKSQPRSTPRIGGCTRGNR